MTAITLVLKCLYIKQKTTIHYNKYTPPGRKALSLSSTSRKAILFRSFTHLVFSFLVMHNHMLFHGAGVTFQICSFSQSLNLNLKIIQIQLQVSQPLCQSFAPNHQAPSMHKWQQHTYSFPYFISLSV